jgi:signal transduction histidine kinase
MNLDNNTSLRILLVEDSAHDVLAFRRAFKKSQIASEITHCVRAEQALERLNADPEHGTASFDLVVTDYKLPGMTGLELCREVLKRNILLPLVLLTGTGSEHLAVEALKTGVNDYIIKDPDQGYLNLLPVVLPEVVRQHDDRLARRRAEETLREHSERLEEMVKARTKELQEAQERLIRQEKLAVLGQLAGGVGHELRNPLAVIKNSVYLLNMVLKDPSPEAQRALNGLEKQVETCDRIINSLLDFARTRSPVWQDVDVDEVLKRAILRVAKPENVKLVTRPDKSLPLIQADPDQLVHVFGNIILNGYQAMPEGGQLVIQSQALAPDWVSVSLTDTGVGISEENLNKLFEPLFTTKPKGIGLGLAITLTLVEGHGGEVLVQSEPEKGSTFTVKLPVGGRREA